MVTKLKTIEATVGQWPSILSTLGISKEFLTGRHGPCPICGGKDRFRFDDKRGKGTFYCNSCGAGDGLDLIQKVKRISFSEAAKMVDDLVAVSGIKPTKVEEKPAVSKAEMAEIWKRGEPLSLNSIGGIYLNLRCHISKFPSCLRMVDDTMVARVTDPGGNGVQLHKTLFDKDGNKIGRKMMRAPMPPGSAIRLHEPVQGVLGVAEGIETALSASRMYTCPVWALINANNLEKWMPPPGVEHIMIFGDNDLSFTGQASAYALAKKLVLTGNYKVDVLIPKQSGWDWNDVQMQGE